MLKFNNTKQLTINKQHRLGSHEEQPLLFSLVHHEEQPLLFSLVH